MRDDAVKVPCLSAMVLATATAAAACSAASDDAADGVRGFEDPLAETDAPDDWVIVFDDEFDGHVVEPSKWAIRTGDLSHKGVLNSGATDRVSVHDGSLFVSAMPSPEDAAFPYKAGFIDTGGLFAQTYGKIEFRVRCDYAPGLWYALWGRPWISEVPEIDVEYLAENVSQAWFVNHWAVPPVKADDRRAFVTVNGIDITRFHTYAIVWKSTSVEWRIDDKPYMRATGRGVPHEPMNWIINAWVGAWGGSPNPATIFPSGFEVEYFRIYRTRVWTTEPLVHVRKPRLKSEEEASLDIELADFDPDAHVEVWEGDRLLASIAKPPFRFMKKEHQLAAGAHSLRLIGTNVPNQEERAALLNTRGALPLPSPRTATTTVDVVIP